MKMTLRGRELPSLRRFLIWLLPRQAKMKQSILTIQSGGTEMALSRIQTLQIMGHSLCAPGSITRAYRGEPMRPVVWERIAAAAKALKMPAPKRLVAHRPVGRPPKGGRKRAA
jgi:hypothetical protein